MRSTTLFFILGLLLVAKATEDVNVFAQIDQDPFGATLLDLVQINMQSNSQSEMKTEDSVNQISDLLSEIQTGMINNKKEADNDHKDFQDKANYDIDQYNRTVIAQRARKASVERQLAADRDLLASTKKDLAASQAHLKDVERQIKEADERNNRALARYQKKVEELKDAIKATKEANAELAKINLGSFAEGAQINMIQIKGGMEKVQKALENHLASRLTIYRPIIQALVDMGTNADPALVKQVVGLINELRNDLEGALSNAHKNEATRVKDYQKLRADLVNDERQTNGRIGRALQLISSLEQNIKQNQAIVDELTKSIPAAEALLAARIQQKREEQASYEAADAIRKSEIATISKLVQFFQEKFSSSMSNYLRQRVARK